MGTEPEEVRNFSAFLPKEFSASVMNDGLTSIAIGTMGILYYLFFKIAPRFEKIDILLTIFGALMCSPVFQLFGYIVRKMRKRYWVENETAKNYYERGIKRRTVSRKYIAIFVLVSFSLIPLSRLVGVISAKESFITQIVLFGTIWICWFLTLVGYFYFLPRMYILAGCYFLASMIYVFALIPADSSITILLLLYGIPTLLSGIAAYWHFHKNILKEFTNRGFS